MPTFGRWTMAVSTEQPSTQIGTEVDLGVRMNMDGTHRYARRAGLMCQFSF